MQTAKNLEVLHLDLVSKLYIKKEKMRKISPKYLLVLIWSFRKEVIKQESDYIKSGGNLVFHLPKFHIINRKNYRFYLNKSFKDMSYRY